MIYATLTYRQTVELIRRLNGGTVGFDYGRFKLADLRAMIQAAILDGTYDAEQVDFHADAVAAAPPADAAPFGASTVATPPALPKLAPKPIKAAPADDWLPPGVNVIRATAKDMRDVGAFVANGCLPVAAPAIPSFIPPILPAAPTPQQVTPSLVAVPMYPAAPTPAPAPVARAVAELVEVVDRLVSAPPPGTVQRSAREVFSDQPAIAAALPAGMTLTCYGHADSPPVDMDYQFSAGNLLLALNAMQAAPTFRCWLGGPRGTGKTEFVRQLAARTGRPLFRVNFNRGTEAAEIIGDIGLANNATLWVDGPVSCALRTAGAVLLLDEITYASPGNVSSLNPVLERNGAAVRLPRTGETLPVDPSVMVFVADNSYGYGAGAEYAGRNVLGADTLDRFAYRLRFDYLPETQERALLRSIVLRETGRKLSATAAGHVTKLLRVARDKAGRGELMGAPSLRGAVAFAVALAHDIPAPLAYDAAIVLGAPDESHEELRQIFSAHWPADAANAADPADNAANLFANVAGSD
jgi:MoxR-like ATPase